MPRGGYRPNAGRKPKGEISLSVLKAKPEDQKPVQGNVMQAEIEVKENKEKTSVAFLEAVIKNNEVDLRLRIEAAKQLLPYQAKKLGETGKKEEAAGKAKSAQRGTEWESLLQ